MSSFVRQLKQRRVYRVALGYGIAAWLIVQVAATVLPAFHAPDFILSSLIVVVGLAFPVALVLAWAFDVTPSGIEKAPAAFGAAAARNTRYAWALAGVGLTIGAVGVAAFWFWHFGATRHPIAPAVTVQNVSAPSDAAAPEKSIAVLPFENLSSDRDNAFFADGVQDEILTDLARVADLKVISRTSVMQYKNATARNLREIAHQLGVAHLLEGSVQRAGNRVRVNAQLIEARTDAHLWAQSYDRDLADVFAIQSEIAEAIATQLQAHLSPAEHAAMMQAPTTDVLANDLYLRAKVLDELANDPGAKQGLLEAANLLTEALRRDPQFVLAWCLLCEVHLDLYWGGFDHTTARREQALRALQRAEEIRPNEGEVHLEKGAYAYHGFRDYKSALAEFEIAGKLLPNSSRLQIYLASVARREGRWDDALHYFDRAIELDPRNGFNYEEAGFTRSGLRRYEEAGPLLERALALNPDDIFARDITWELPYFARGETAQWRSHLDAVRAEGNEAAAHLSAMFVACALAERDHAAAVQALALIPPEGAVNPLNDSLWPRDWYVGLVARSFGDIAAAQSAFVSARVEAAKVAQEQPDYEAAWSALGAIDAALGHKAEAIAEGRHAVELLPVTKDAWAGPSYVTNLALIFAWLGEKDLAFEQLAHSAKIPAGINYGELKLSPMWDALRGDPRFDAILASLAPKITASR